jgi:hypothetical protein
MEHFGGAVGEVDNPAGDNRSSIIDPDIDNSPVAEVGHTYPAAERQSRVSRSQIVHLIGFTAGRGTAFKFFSIP